MARGRLRQKLPALRKALTGRFREHHAFLVGPSLAHLDYLEQSIAEISRRLEEQLRPFAEAVESLITIPVVQRRTAEVILAEIGADMNRFASSPQLVSWAGMCPGKAKASASAKAAKPQGQQMAAAL